MRAAAKISTASGPEALVLFSRQRQLLQLLDAFGGAVGNLDFQKLLFLHCQEQTSVGPYEFVPSKFGAFSFTSYADRRKLVERGLVVDSEHAWELTDLARRVVGGTPDMILCAFAKRYRILRGDALVADDLPAFSVLRDPQ